MLDDGNVYVGRLKYTQNGKTVDKLTDAIKSCKFIVSGSRILLISGKNSFNSTDCDAGDPTYTI